MQLGAPCLFARASLDGCSDKAYLGLSQAVNASGSLRSRRHIRFRAGAPEAAESTANKAATVEGGKCCKLISTQQMNQVDYGHGICQAVWGHPDTHTHTSQR